MLLNSKQDEWIINSFVSRTDGSLTEIKSKKRERLQMINEKMRVCLFIFEPRIIKMCSQKQNQIKLFIFKFQINNIFAKLLFFSFA